MASLSQTIDANSSTDNPSLIHNGLFEASSIDDIPELSSTIGDHAQNYSALGLSGVPSIPNTYEHIESSPMNATSVRISPSSSDKPLPKTPQRNQGSRAPLSVSFDPASKHGPNLPGRASEFIEFILLPSNSSSHKQLESSRPHIETVKARPRVIYFYERSEPFFEFTNFSPHSVIYKGKRYPTAEHLFQAMKFMDHRPGLAEHIRTHSERSRAAYEEARRFQPEWRSDWHKIKVEKMDEVLYHKFGLDSALAQLLIKTGDAELVEDSPVDSFWSVGADRKGRNELGKALMRTRAWLLSSTAPEVPMEEVETV